MKVHGLVSITIRKTDQLKSCLNSAQTNLQTVTQQKEIGRKFMITLRFYDVLQDLNKN